MPEVMTPPTIGAAIRFITSAPLCVAGAHMMGSSPKRIAQIVMIFGRMRWTAPSMTAPCKSVVEFMRPGAKSVPGLVEIQQHHDASFRVKPGQRDKADPYGHTHVVAEQIKKPERAHQREGHGKKHDTRFHHAPGIQVDEQQNDEQREGDDDFEPLLRALEILELPGPLNVVAWRKLHRVMDALRRGLYVAFDITTCDVYKDEADELAVLVADKRRTGLVGNIGEHGDRYLRQRWAGRRLYRAPRTSGYERHRGCLRCARRQRHEHALE